MSWVNTVPKWIFSGAFIVLVGLIVYLAITGKEFRYKDGFRFVSMESAEELNITIPYGTILPWDPIYRSSTGEATGDTKPIPEGWTVCDGTNGTPELDNVFLMGVSAKNNAGVSAGSNSLQLSDIHDHGGSSSNLQYQAGQVNWDTRGGYEHRYSHKHVISNDGAHDHGGDKRPAHYSVLFLCLVE